MEAELMSWVSAPVFIKKHQDLFSKNTFYTQIRKGRIPHLRVGRKIFVPSDALERMLQAQSQGPQTDGEHVPDVARLMAP